MNVLNRIALTANDVGIPDITSEHLVYNILNLVYFIAGIAAVIIIVIAGLTFVTSSGDAARVKKARAAIIDASVGLVVIMTAFTITYFIIGRF